MYLFFKYRDGKRDHYFISQFTFHTAARSTVKWVEAKFTFKVPRKARDRHQSPL